MSKLIVHSKCQNIRQIISYLHSSFIIFIMPFAIQYIFISSFLFTFPFFQFSLFAFAMSLLLQKFNNFKKYFQSHEINWKKKLTANGSVILIFTMRSSNLCFLVSQHYMPLDIIWKYEELHFKLKKMLKKNEKYKTNQITEEENTTAK